MCSQPIKEEYLLSAALEPTNEWYAIAKIAGIKACEAVRKQYGRDFISLMPTNTFGPFDNFDLETSHVLPSLLRKFYEAILNEHAPVTLWGDGSAMREFIYVDDLAEAIVFSLENDLNEHIYNVGTGADLSIKELALLIRKISGHQGEIIWDHTKPNGTPRKVLDVSKLNKKGWFAKTTLEEGLLKSYQWLSENYHQIREIKSY
jgi:GDP-L-fucose synthase